MRVLALPADQWGCGFYRIHAPIKALAGQAEFSFAGGIPARRPRTRLEVVGVDPLEVDVVILQRPLAKMVVDCIPFIQAQGIAVVVDIDDDFTCLHHKHSIWSNVQPRLNPVSNWRHLQRACAQADLVTVSTPALAQRFGARGNAHLLRNCVPEWYTNLERVPQVTGQRWPVIGWAGYTHSHPDDLKATMGSLARLCPEAGTFVCVGDGEGVAAELGMASEDVEVVGHVPLTDYPRAIGRFDVGIVPLQDNRFNAAKSYLKGLEYAALGIPFVASDVSEYRVLEEMGIGLTAGQRQRDWVRQLHQAIRQSRRGWGDFYRARVREELTYEVNGWRWLEAWARAMQKAAIRCAA